METEHNDMPAKSNKKTAAVDELDQFDVQDQFDNDNDESEDGDVINLDEIPDKIEYEVLPTGIYNGIVEDVEFRESSNGNPMLSWVINVTHEGKNHKTFAHTVLTGNSAVRTKKTLNNLVPHAPGGEYFNPTKFNPNRAKEIFVGTEVRVRLSIDQYQGNPRNKVNEILPPSADMDDPFVS